MNSLLNNDCFFSEQILKRLDRQTINKLMTSCSKMSNIVVSNLDKIKANLTSLRRLIDQKDISQFLPFNPRTTSTSAVMLNDGHIYSKQIIENNDIISTIYMRNYKRHGPLTTLVNGEIVYSSTYINGKREGLEFQYKDKDRPRFYTTIVKTFYVNGMKHGKEQIIEEGDYQDEYEYFKGIKHGDYKRLSADGRLLKCGYYNNGSKDGIFSNWSRQGKLINTRTYDRGLVITKTLKLLVNLK